MKLVSVNTALPRHININGRQVLTGIYKEPVPNRIWMRKLNLAGDGQADLAVHGGEHQAVYSYPFEHYAYWQHTLNKSDLPMGTFGENLTVSGLLETEVCVGDILQIGDGSSAAVVQITMPRIPCFKFGHKIGRPDILDEFLLSGRSGFYQRVLTEGEVGAGDVITVLERDPNKISIRTALGLQKLGEGDSALLQHALQVKTLPPLLRGIYEARLAENAA